MSQARVRDREVAVRLSVAYACSLPRYEDSLPPWPGTLSTRGSPWAVRRSGRRGTVGADIFHRRLGEQAVPHFHTIRCLHAMTQEDPDTRSFRSSPSLRDLQRIPPPSSVNDALTTEPLPAQTFDVAFRSASVSTDHDSLDESQLLQEALAGLNDRSLGGRYQIGSVLGRGGMGVVFKGWDTQLERVIAVKIRLLDPQQPARIQRFLREARIAGRLNHPGIMAVHEFGISGNSLAFIVMRLLEGQTLKALLASRQNVVVELPRLLAIFLQTCQAVAFAHDQGVIHRDLKPSNIMVEDYGVVTVLDWGLAKVLSDPDGSGEAADRDGSQESVSRDVPFFPINDQDTACGTIIGTPSYLPPEQARGDIGLVDRRSDVFALGAILCEILTGVPPFTAVSGTSIWAQSAQASLASAHDRLDASGGPRPIVDLAKRCLAPEQHDRPDTAQALVDEVIGYLESGQRRAEKQLVQFFDLSVDLFCIAGLNGYFSRVNENFPRILGYSTATLLSQKFLDFVHPEDIDSTVAEVERLGRGELTIEFLNRYRHADGHYLWLEWTARSVPEERLIYAVARDVSERVSVAEARARLERERSLLAEIVESADDAIISKDLNGAVQSWNKGAEHLFGYTAAEMIGRQVTMLIPSERLHEEETILRMLRAGQRVDHFETVRVAKDGRRIDVSISVSPVHDADGNIIGAAKIARDIGDRKHLEAELERSRRKHAGPDTP